MPVCLSSLLHTFLRKRSSLSSNKQVQQQGQEEEAAGGGSDKAQERASVHCAFACVRARVRVLRSHLLPESVVEHASCPSDSLLNSCTRSASFLSNRSTLSSIPTSLTTFTPTPRTSLLGPGSASSWSGAVFSLRPAPRNPTPAGPGAGVRADSCLQRAAGPAWPLTAEVSSAKSTCASAPFLPRRAALPLAIPSQNSDPSPLRLLPCPLAPPLRAAAAAAAAGCEVVGLKSVSTMLKARRCAPCAAAASSPASDYGCKV